MSLQTLVSCEQLLAEHENSSWRVFDCRFDLADPARGQCQYDQGHVPGALYAHLDHDLSGPITPHSGRHPLPDRERLRTWLGQCGVHAGCQVVAYDASGGSMAVRLWWLLRWLGHNAVAVLDGGWPAWTQTGLPIATHTPTPTGTTDLVERPALVACVSSADIERQVAAGGDEILLLDVRSGERFHGEAEPIDPVAGHIPGAINLPLQQNLDSNGRFKTAAELRAIYAAALDGRDPGRIGVMCGSGVTACHSLLAMEIAGLHGARLYDGSWSEWIRDPTRPVSHNG